MRAQRLVAAAAVLDGRDAPSATDLWVLPMIAPSADDQVTAQEALADLLAAASSATLAHAAEQFARGRRARAARLTASGEVLLEELDGATVGHAERLRAEATLREIDAGFGSDEMPEELGLVRARLAVVVDSGLHDALDDHAAAT